MWRSFILRIIPVIFTNFSTYHSTLKSFWNNFPAFIIYPLEIHSINSVLLKTLGFCLPENVFISVSFVWYNNFGLLLLFPLRTLKIAFHCFLSYMYILAKLAFRPNQILNNTRSVKRNTDAFHSKRPYLNWDKYLKAGR